VNADALIDSLAGFPATLTAAMHGMADADIRWKPASNQWSILEIVRHLGDEEIDDFRRRLFLTLEHPKEAWPPIDPEYWAEQRTYNQGEIGEALQAFTRERGDSIAQLRALVSPAWSASHHHTVMGEITAGDLLAAWTAHDMLHLRQIAKRKYQLIRRHAGEYRTGYAGEWKE